MVTDFFGIIRIELYNMSLFTKLPWLRESERTFLVFVPDNTPIPGLQMNLLESYSSFVIPHKNKHKISKSNKQNAIIIRYTKLCNM